MQLQIESLHVALNAGLEEEARTKFEHLNQKYQRLHRCEVVFRIEKSKEQKPCLVEATLHLPGTVLFASEHDTTFEIALDKLKSDLDRQLLKQKEEVEDLR